MPFCGEPLIERVLRRTSGLAGEIILTVSQPGDLAFLGLPVVADLFPGKGPLGGLYTALLSAANPEVMVVACDMPFANHRLLLAECDLLAASQAGAVIPVSPFGFEPLHAVYRREVCLPAVKSALINGQLRLSSWFSNAQVRMMTLDEVAEIDPQFNAFINVNSPAEFERAESLARQIG